MKKTSALVLALLFLSWLTLAQSLNEMLDKYYQAIAQAVDGVLAKNYQTRGGLDKLRAVEAMKCSGKILILDRAMAIPMAMWQKNPNKMRIETTFEGKKIVRAYDGQKAWWIMPFISEDAQEMPPEQAGILKEQADFKNPLVFYKEMGYKLELLGKEAMAGTAVFKLKLIKTDGKEVLFYLDAGSGIELKSALAIKNGDSDSLKEIVFSDYKPVNGVMMPFRIENRINGKAQMQMTMDLVEINPVIDDAMFVMPLKKDGAKVAGQK